MRSFVMALAFFGAGGAQAQTPQVLAAWSQVIGETLPMASAPAAVEMRFVIDSRQTTPSGADAACAEFLIAPPRIAASGVVKIGQAPVARKVHFKDIVVCRMKVLGSQAQLFYTNGQPVTLVSMKNLHNTSLDAQHWVPGPSNGADVIVAGPDWIGRDAGFRLLTLGDTGCCGGKPRDRSFQNCTRWETYDDWPFEQISSVGAIIAPDLVIHVGDFRYFQENSLRTDTWQLWQKDFFPLAQPLLLAAPWAMTRGNHEGCESASLSFGIGYFQFFGQSDKIDCSNLVDNAPAGEAPIYRVPWYFDVIPNTGAPEDAHRFAMIDANDYQGSTRGVNFDQAEAHFKTAIDITNSGNMSSWWVGHSLAVQRITYKPEAFGDPMLRTALLSAAGLSKSDGERFCSSSTGPNCNPSMFLLGH
jgi:hypothetical protein